MSSIARLVVTVGGRGVWFLPEGIYQIGRSPDCELRFDDGQISRIHASLIVDGDTVGIIDHRSRNGTYVNGQPVGEAILEPGFIIQFGPIECVYDRLEYEGVDASTYSGGANPNVLEPRLSQAEARIFILLLDGLSEKEIAVRRNLSPHTVHNHVKRIYAVYRVHSRAELLSKALSARREI